VRMAHKWKNASSERGREEARALFFFLLPAALLRQPPPPAFTNALNFSGSSRDAAGNVIEMREHAGDWVARSLTHYAKFRSRFTRCCDSRVRRSGQRD
jgi:hypothetical protein